MTTWLLLAACGRSSGDDADGTGDTDTDADTDTDTDTDTDADTDSDTDADTDSDTDTDPPSCALADLVWRAEVRDAAGTAGMFFPFGGTLTFVGIVENPCASDVAFDTPQTCLVSRFDVLNQNPDGYSYPQVCDPQIANWVVPAGGVIEVSDSDTPGRDDWTLTVRFADPGSHQAVANFRVQ
jgi:hypothetical protein